MNSHSAIPAAFGKTHYPYSLGSLTTDQKAAELTRLINENPAGVIVRLVAGTKGHSIVFTGSSYPVANRMNSFSQPLTTGVRLTPENEKAVLGDDFFNVDYDLDCSPSDVVGVQSAINMSSPYDSYFTVYDPAVGTASVSAGVLFTNCYSYATYGGIENITSVTVIK